MELLIDGGLLDGVLPRKPLCLQPCGVSTESGSRDALGGSSISDDGGGSSTDNGGSRYPAEGNEDAAEVSSSDIAVDIKPLTGTEEARYVSLSRVHPARGVRSLKHI